MSRLKTAALQAALLALAALVAGAIIGYGASLFRTSTPRIQRHAYLYPDKLTRGPLLSYHDGRILLGPYPEDREWDNVVLNPQKREVVSYLDPDDPDQAALIEKERELCRRKGVVFTSLPVRLAAGESSGLKELGQYLDGRSGWLYVHGRDDDDVFRLLDGYLRNSAFARHIKAPPPGLDPNQVYMVNPNLLLGAILNEATQLLLAEAGVTGLIPARTQAGEPIGRMIEKVLKRVTHRPGVFYVWGFPSEAEIEVVGRAISNRFYGVGLGDAPKRINGRKVTIVGHRLIVGPQPKPEEIKAMAPRGIATIIFLEGEPESMERSAAQVEEMVEDTGLRFRRIAYEEGYEALIDAEARRDDNPCYVIAPIGEQYAVGAALKKTILQ